ncbi:MAG: hypothetical protein NVS1B4_16710 [Gemmatimonadaceae bacterium]
MLDAAVAAVGVSRLLWGGDLTMETALAKLRAFSAMDLSAESVSAIRWRNAAAIFPPGTFAIPATGHAAGGTALA